MKFMRFAMVDSTKVAELSKTSDKVFASPPKGIKVQAIYACLGIVFPEQPTNTIITVNVLEAENVEALAAVSYPLTQAGATVWAVPILDVPVGGAAQVEKKFKG
jgi:energy-converting hydrogenase Eha subunit C